MVERKVWSEEWGKVTRSHSHSEPLNFAKSDQPNRYQTLRVSNNHDMHRMPRFPTLLG